MIVGHYAAALLPYSRLRDLGTPLWLLLLCANVPEFLWLGLALAGVEPAHPASFVDASLQNLEVDMLYSHDLVPALVQAAVVGGVVALVWSRRVALWCAALVVVHVLCDYVVGFQHHLLGPGTLPIGLDSYGSMPLAAVGIELAFAVAGVFAYQRSEASLGRPVSPRRLKRIYAVLVVGVLLFLPSAFGPLRDFLPS